MSRERKDGQWWVVRLNGEKAVVQVFRNGTYLYECGCEEGWDLTRDQVAVEWLRRVKL